MYSHFSLSYLLVWETTDCHCFPVWGGEGFRKVNKINAKFMHQNSTYIHVHVHVYSRH